jgi:hypothetical protein
MLEVLAENAESMVIEEIGELGEGIEFSVTRPGGVVEAHQVKRQLGNSNSWSISALVGLGVVSAAVAQNALGREFHFVSTVPSRRLQELTDRSRGADSFEVFRQNLPESLRPEFETFATAVGAQTNAFDILRSFYVQVIDERELRRVNETIARLLTISATSAPATAAAVLADIAIDNLGRILNALTIRQELKRYGLNATDASRAPTLVAAVREAEDLRLARLSPIIDQLAKVREIAPAEGLRERKHSGPIRRAG